MDHKTEYRLTNTLKEKFTTTQRTNGPHHCVQNDQPSNRRQKDHHTDDKGQRYHQTPCTQIPGDVLSSEGGEGEKGITQPDPDRDGQLGIHQVEQQHHVVGLQGRLSM